MNREIEFQEDLICDYCGRDGAYDFHGDHICDECLAERKPGNYDEPYP